MVDRVADDHRRARALAAGLAAVPGMRLRPEVIETNIVLADVSGTGIAPTELVSLLADAGLRVLEADTSRIRLVTHRLIGDDEIERAVALVAETVTRHAVPLLELPELDDSWEAELALEDD
jgi:threonine aldolase